MIDERTLLTDEQMLRFVVQGHHLVQTDFSAEFHQAVCERIEEVFSAEGNPGNDILERVPALQEVYDHPAVVGALTSILGPDYRMNRHRHCHRISPGSGRQGWHQDDVNHRHHRIPRVLAMYYPHEVTAELGPTTILPGTQYRNAPTARMASYGDFRSQLPMIVPAGAVAIVHYDIWHCAMPNRGDRPRLMLKFLFDRTSAPTQPSWNADPANREGLYPEFIRSQLPIDNQSDAYKHRVMWMDLWTWLWGGQPETGPTIIDHYP